MGVVVSARRAGRAIAWFVRGLVREDAYEKYVAHVRATHPGDPVMSERAFWRDHSDRQESHPQGRCC